MNAQRLLKSMMSVALLVLISTMSFAQEKVITTSGTVADSKSGVGIPGISVTVKGTTTGTTTNSEGNFTLKVPAGSVLVFSSVGFKDKEQVAEDGAMFITMEASATNLNEIVVVGYSTVRKKDLTGSVTTVTAKDFQTGNIQSPDQLIAGKVAGVNIIQNGGSPGAGSTIRIRGGSSLNATNNPLIVIDGVPVDNISIAGSANPLSLINPADIESFNILKDASAAAIYGSRASNGVIIITTKKGKRGKPQFNFGTSLIVSEPYKTVDVMDAQTFDKFVRDIGDQKFIAMLGTANTNWQDEIYQTALGTDNNLSISGALGNMPYRASFGYLNQDGILRTDNLQRITGAISISPRLLNNHLKVDLNLKGSNSQNRFADQGAIGSAFRFDPTQPVKSGKSEYGGYTEWKQTGGPGGLNRLATLNPVSLLNQRRNTSDVNRFIGNVQLDYKFHFLPELRANLNVGTDRSEGSGNDIIDTSAASQIRQQRKGQNNIYKQENTNDLLEFYLNYATDLKKLNSRIDVMAGYSYQDFQTKNYNYNDRLFSGADNPATANPRYPFDIPQYTLISYFGRLNYTIADKYILTGTIRRDGSSRFKEDNRWGVFPSGAFAWKIIDEDFMANNNTFSDLKLRVGYGITGQQDIGERYGYLSRFSVSESNSGYGFGGQIDSTLFVPVAYNEDLKWEETHQFNIGIDFGFLDNKVTGSLEYFNKKSKDLLFEVPIPVGANFTNQLITNVGELVINGAEVTLNYSPIKTDKSALDLSFNATYLNREITKVRGDEDPSFKGVQVGGIDGGTGNTIQILSKGYAPNAFYVYKQIYNAEGKPMEGLYEDLNRDGIINQDDRYQYKKPDADIYLGFSAQYSISNFSAGFIMRSGLGNYVYNNVFSETGVSRNITNPVEFLQNASTNVLDTRFVNNQYFSDYYVHNASFLRVDNINLGYNFGSLIGKGTQLRATANVQNAFVVTNYEGVDPEVQGIDRSYYPRPRTFTVGLNLGF